MILRILFGLWVLFVFSDLFAEALIIYGFWKEWKRGKAWVGIYWSAAVGGALVESFLTIIVALSGTSAPASLFNVVVRLIGRSAKAAGFWAMAIRVLKEERTSK